MRVQQVLKWTAVGVIAAALVAVWFLYIKYEDIEKQKDISSEGISQILIRVRDVDLVLKESGDGKIHAALTGEKARSDSWTLEAGTEGASLQIESAFIQKAYLNYKDHPRRELIVSLPKKSYNSIRLIESSHWRNASFSIPESDGTPKTWSAAGLKGRKELESPFGIIVLSD
ncbi:hypothetical protein C8Z91_11540 [Paenibacillus elgii]|uniref:Uncharacterized protein n=1 Tax=Paenibacillus elgii TaxID=189691 RepID=A0A2T6G4L8_9BACL|nr:hypothetical protein [Paenibacillus elgii]PUA39095.1 hypothetical protein C8Z91_11540 [Paenibacillus elgii]